MTTLVLDSGGVSRLSQRRPDVAALIAVFERDGLWPPLVPSVVLVESLAGRPRTDVMVNRFIKTCDVSEELTEQLARRAALLRARAGTGSAVDAVVVAVAEPGGTVLGSDVGDLRALAAYADGVTVHRV